MWTTKISREDPLKIFKVDIFYYFNLCILRIGRLFWETLGWRFIKENKLDLKTCFFSWSIAWSRYLCFLLIFLVVSVLSFFFLIESVFFFLNALFFLVESVFYFFFSLNLSLINSHPCSVVPPASIFSYTFFASVYQQVRRMVVFVEDRSDD